MPSISFAREIRHRGLLLGAAFLCAMYATAAAQSAAPESAEENPAASPSVQFDNGLVTLEAEGVPLEDLLDALARAADFRLVKVGDLSAPVTRSMHGVALDSAVRRLLGNHTVVMIYASGSGGQRRLAELRIYADDRLPPPVPDGPDVEKRLLAALQQPDPALRRGALSMADALDDEVAIAILGEVLERDQDPRVRADAASALGRIGGDQAVQALEGGLGDGDPGVASAIARALGRAGGERATLVLEQMVMGDEDPKIRAIAVQTVASLRTPGAREVVEAAAEDENDHVRRAAQQALENWP